MDNLPKLGQNLRVARKRRFPNDDLKSFALRIGVSRATLQKMEAGQLSVTLANYYRAAEILELTEAFDSLFEIEQSLFED